MSDSQERVIDPKPKPSDNLDYALRPKRLVDLIGQTQIKENIQIRR